MRTLITERSRRFLFVVIEGGGTVPPELGLAGQLVERGHTVRVLADPCIEADARAAGCDFVPFVHAPHRINRLPDTALFRDWEIHNPIELLSQVRKLIFGQARAYAQDVLDDLERVPADVLATEAVLLGVIAAAEKVRVPTALLMPNIYMFPAPGIPAFGPGFLPARGPLGRLRDAVLGKLFMHMLALGLPELNAARAQLGLDPLGHPFEQFERADRLLVMTSQAFDFPAHVLPPNVRYVGPQLDDPAWAQAWESPWPVNHPLPLVVVGFSSTFQNQGPILQKVIDALGKLRVRGLVTLGPGLDGAQFRCPPNVVVRPSAPHAAVFAEAAAVITHAGHGTVIRALAHGVPLICLPMGRDQNDNAARVVARGAGIRLSTKTSVSALQQAIRRVLEEPEFRINARLLAIAIATDVRRQSAVAELEELAMHRSRTKGSGAESRIVGDVSANRHNTPITMGG
jgi:UDP:flavonoid glycosyltransferase YjiC (YdhE family)